MADKKVRAQLVGATGYGGLGILELLLGHPNFEIAFQLRAPVSVDPCSPGVVMKGVLTPLGEALSTGRWAMSPKNPRFPLAVAGLFDVIEACGWQLSRAAPELRLTTSALSRALSEEDIVFRAANERRTALGLPTLHADR